jgi:NAD(P)H-flavin reductase
MSSSSPDHVATLLETWDETPTLVGVRLDAPEIARAHHAPGQFLTLAGTTPVAIASAPGHGLELLLKKDGTAWELLAPHRPGDRVDVDGPSGHGYPLAAHAGRDLVLLGAGSGIAPLHAVVQAILDERARWGAVHVYYGHREPEEFAYRREVGAWRAAAVNVIEVVSGMDAAWTGARGRVHQVLEAAPPPLAGAVAYVCGMPEMVADATATLARLGVPGERVFRNH